MRVGVVLGIAFASPALAADCAPATSGGSAPPSWPTYCWIDFSTYNDVTARSAGGQNFSILLTDGATLSFKVNAVSSAATAVSAVVSPSWTGAAVGNTAFLGIPGRPILYTINSPSTVTITISAIAITPPPGVPSVTSYAVVIADAESTNENESLTFTTNGTNWVVLDAVPPITGNAYPTTTNTGSVFTENGVGGTVGGYIVGSGNPTTVSARMVAGGLQGVMFAVRFATIALDKVIVRSRLNTADQFNYRITGTSSGTVLSSGVSTGAGNGPFSSAAVSFASGLPVTLSETMAAGSVSALANYASRLTCTNSAPGSPTVLPNNVATTSYSFGALAFGDAVLCRFTNTPFPKLQLIKALGGNRVFANDQFTVNITNGAATVATATTTGTASTVNTGTTPPTIASAGTTYGLGEVGASGTVLSYYTAGMACTNTLAGSTTVLPTTVPGNITPILGDNISCTITNTPRPATALLSIRKTSAILSDPVNNTTAPKAIPGAVIRYSITVTNTATGAVDTNTVVMSDPIPANMVFYASTVPGPPVQFINGSPGSGLAYVYGTDVRYSNQPGGGAPFTYTPVPDANGYDAAVRGVRVAPAGQMSGGGPTGPTSFTLQFQARVN